MFRRSGVVVELGGDEKRIFERSSARAGEGERQRRRRDRASAQARSRAASACSRTSSFVANAQARGGRGRAREARPLPARARCPLRLTLGRVPQPVAAGVRARTDADAAGRARRPAARLPGDPRRRHERQVDRDPDDRGAAARGGALGRRDRLSARPHVGGADHRRRRGGRLRGGDRAGPARGRGAGGDAVRDGLRRCVRGVRGAATSTSPSSRRGSAAGSTRRTSSRSHVVLLTNVGLEHTDVLGDTRELIAAEKLAVVQEGTVVVLPDEEFAHLAGPDVSSSAARARRPPPSSAARSSARSRWRCRAGSSDAATRSVTAPTTPTARRWLVAQLDRDDYTIVASILRDKDASAMLSALATRGRRFVATESPNARALLGRRARPPRLAPLLGGRDRARSRRRARPRARASARPRHRLAVPSCGFGEERGVI